MKSPIWCPVLQVQGEADPTVLPRSARGSEVYVQGPYRWLEIPDSGHFPHEERPQAFHAGLLDWLATV